MASGEEVYRTTKYKQTIKQYLDMKKVYLAPQTEAIQMLGENAIMAASGGAGGGFIYGEAGTGGSPR